MLSLLHRTKTYLSEVENGKKPGSTALFVACAKALDVTLDDLILQ